MCFYVNLRELWPFRSFSPRPSNRGEGKANVKSSKNNQAGHKTDAVSGELARWNGTEFATNWLNESELSRDEKSAPSFQASADNETQRNVIPANDSTQTNHYGDNLLESLAREGPKGFALNGGVLLAGAARKTTSETENPSDTSNVPINRSSNTMSGQQQLQPQQASQQTSNNNVNQEEGAQKARPETQQQQQQRQQDTSQLPEPSRQALAEAAKFRIRTARRRHLDFDDEYSLDDPNAPQRSKWSGPFHFIQAADCQFGMIDSYVHHRTQPGWREEIELCERLVGICNQMQPKPLFMIICGDLVDSLPRSEIGRRQVVDFKRIFAKLDQTIPLVCVCGNHDVGDEPTNKTIRDYRETFGEDYFYFTKNDLLFIVINSQFYQNRGHVQEEAREQDRWLESVLSKCKLFKYSIIFEHIPWFLEEPEEENDYFNIRKEVRLEWLKKFKAAGVTKIMCGHYHRNAGGWLDDMELVVTSAIGAQLGSARSGIRIVRVLDKSIEHKYYAMEEVPSRIELD